jgi:hypothetical protein
MQRDLVVVILYDGIYNEYKIVRNSDNLWYLQFLHFYDFVQVIDTNVQNNDNEISLYFKPMRLIFMNSSV